MSHRTQIDPNKKSAMIAKLLGKEKMIELVKQIVLNYYNVKEYDFNVRRQKREDVKLKYVCMYVIKNNSTIPLHTIGIHFGGMDHASVLYAVRKIGELMEMERDLKSQVTDITNILTARSSAFGTDSLGENVYYLDMNDVTAMRINNTSGIVFTGISKSVIEEIKQKYFSSPAVTLNEFKDTGLFILHKIEKDDNIHKSV